MCIYTCPPGLSCFLAIVHGPTITVPDDIILWSFERYLSCHDGSIVKETMKECEGQVKPFSNETKSQLINILSSLGCHQIPQPGNLRGLLVRVARHEFFTKPLEALHALHSGIPTIHHEWWKRFSVERLFGLYKSLNATPQQVINKLKEPDIMEPDEARMFGYLTSFLGNLSLDELTSFLRFVTGSSSLILDDISVMFNRLSGVARRPISHTCSCVLELSTDYLTYLDFSQEFYQVLMSSESWAMDAV